MWELPTRDRRYVRCRRESSAREHRLLFNAIVCLVDDANTGRRLPRNYLETLEERVQLLEGLLQKHRPGHVQRPAAKENERPSSRPTNHEPVGHGVISKDEGVEKKQDSDDVSSALLSETGALSLRASGADPHYFGASSIFSFSRMIHACVRKSAHEALVGSSLSATGLDELAVSPCALPPLDVAMTLSDTYFESVHLQYPFLHEPTFRQWELLAHGLGSRFATPVELFFVNAVSIRSEPRPDGLS